ncbi:MAG: hypothetical protein QF436_01645 [Candidatus Woesearchaeota archaeon]|jgi:hypothetical protein|nr:hypothetical protein [Candidatus Woesearchaeota archaeon]MDP7622796.1 hypothetical protein [Candidatus Woesearchaeota archaeon]HJN56471.1 hypothetical protein [Candidatus Woesearchaeota archaeon]|tara:strand:+ start:85622 stop:86245 length:624 start_codon:yes stop_codon:yes gene_type:complete
MPKKRKVKEVKKVAPVKVKATEKTVQPKPTKTDSQPKSSAKPAYFSNFFDKQAKIQKTEYRSKEEEELQDMVEEVNALNGNKKSPKAKSSIPAWFYIASIFAAFLFTSYISIFAALHFEDIEFMNITIVFLFISIVSYFLISSMYFISEKNRMHSIPPMLFFIGITSIMIYAFKAVDTSNLVRFSIMYTIVVAAVSMYFLTTRKGKQ